MRWQRDGSARTQLTASRRDARAVWRKSTRGYGALPINPLDAVLAGYEYSPDVLRSMLCNIGRQREPLPPSPGGTNYLICYLQRSGSTHLTSLLQNTGIAGKPADFFNATYSALPKERAQVHARTGVHTIADSAAQYGSRDPVEYLDTVAALTRSPNGAFGLKVDLAAAAILIRAGLFADPAWNWKYIFVTRRDLILQAVSYVSALQTGAWSSMSRPSAAPQLTEDAIVDRLMWLSESQRRWECIFSLFGIQPLRIDYEAIEWIPRHIVACVLSHIGVEADEHSLPIASEYSMQRSGDSLRWAQRVRALVTNGIRANSSAPVRIHTSQR